MSKKLPETGSSALTYDRNTDIGVFDGRIVAPKNRSKDNNEALADADQAGPKGFMVPLVAGLVLVLVGAAAVAYTVTTVVVSDRIAARAQVELRDRFAQRQALAADGLLTEAFDPTVAIGPGEASTGAGFDDADDVPVIIGAPSDSGSISDPRQIAGWLSEAPPNPGDAVGRIQIPTAGIDWVVVEGVNPDDLKKGPGHMQGTPLPGQYGNAVLSGHRTTYGGPFGTLDRLAEGDRFTVETLVGTHTYEVVSVAIVRPTDTWVVQPREGAWLTLITCSPKYSSRQRLIVFSKLVDGPNAAFVASFYGTDYPPPVPPDGAAPLPVPILTTTTSTSTTTTSTTTPTTTVPPTTTTTAPATTTTTVPATTTTTTTVAATTTTTIAVTTTTTTEP